MAVLVGAFLPTSMRAAFDPELVAQKDRYVKDIAFNASTAYSYGRLITVGQTLKLISPITIILAVPAIADLLSSLGALGYGPYLWITFLAIRNLTSLAKKHPGILTEKDKRILQTAKDIYFKGPVWHFIAKKQAIKKAIKKAAQEAMNSLFLFDKKIAAKPLANYLERFVDVATYERLKRQRREAVEKMMQRKSWGILTKIISRAKRLINKIADHPALKASMARKKKKITNFQNALAPEARILLQQHAASLLKKIDLIKQQTKFASRIEELIEESKAVESKNK